MNKIKQVMARHKHQILVGLHDYLFDLGANPVRLLSNRTWNGHSARQSCMIESASHDSGNDIGTFGTNVHVINCGYVSFNWEKNSNLMENGAIYLGYGAFGFQSYMIAFYSHVEGKYLRSIMNKYSDNLGVLNRNFIPYHPTAI